MKTRRDLFGYQADKFIPALVARKQVAAFVPTGLGKTISTLTALVDLGSPKTLVVAPARVVEMDVWGKEARAWDHTCRNAVCPLVGGPVDREILLASSEAEVEVISYNLLPWLCEAVDLEKRYGAIVFDELSMLKHPGSTRFKRVRTRTMEIPIRIGLTASPRGNHLRDLWGEMYAVAGEKPLGPSKVQFDMTYFTAYPIAENVSGWTMNHGAEELIFERIKPWAFSLDPADAPKWPIHVNPVHVPLPKYVEDLSKRLAQELEIKLASGTDLIALSAGSRVSKLRQMAGGAVIADTVTGEWEEIHDEKLAALEEVIEGLQGEPALVAYWYKHERERILKRFPQARELKSRADEEAWNRGEIEMLLVHPASVGHGINLQFGGHNIVWFTIPWSYEMWQQTNGRLPRPGQVSPFCMATVLLAGETDRAVLGSLTEKRDGQDRLIKAVEL